MKIVFKDLTATGGDIIASLWLLLYYGINTRPVFQLNIVDLGDLGDLVKKPFISRMINHMT